MFSSDFLEARKATYAEHTQDASMRLTEQEGEDHLEYDSDEETDEFYQTCSTTPPLLPPTSLQYHQVSLSHAYTTYRAVLCFLATGYCPFSPLSSTFSPSTPSPAATAMSSKHAYLEKWAQEHPHLPLPASPKSVYRLADLLDLPSLASLALERFKQDISHSNVSAELFSTFGNTREEPRKAMVEVAVQHWEEVRESKQFKDMETDMKRNEVKYGAVVADLLPYTGSIHGSSGGGGCIVS